MPLDPLSRRNFILGLGASGLLLPTAGAAAAQEAGAPQAEESTHSSAES
jgi:hypothetical protein